MKPDRRPKLDSVETLNRQRYAAVLQKHLRELGWGQSDLAAKSGVSQPQLSGWLAEDSTKQQRVVTRGKVCQIAVALAKGYDEKGNPQFGVKQLDGILNEILESAGFSAIGGVPENFLWESISTRRLENLHSNNDEPIAIRVGWFNWGQFADDSFKGPSREIIDLLAELMGMRVEPKKIEKLRDIESAISCREVDLVAPLLAIPSRMFSLAMSAPLREIDGHMNFLVHEDHYEELFVNSDGPRNSSRQINAKRARINIIRGGTSECFRPKLSEPEVYPNERHETLREAIDLVLDKPIVKGDSFIRVLCASDFICKHQQLLHSSRGAKVVLDDSVLKFDIVVGVNPHEPLLMNVVNSCIRVMQDNGSLKDIKRRYPNIFSNSQVRS